MSSPVLVTELDVFARSDDVKRFYAHMVESNPSIDFVLLERTPAISPLRNVEIVHILPEGNTLGSTPFLRAEDIARAVAGRDFSAVEIASTSPHLWGLRRALQDHRSTAAKYCVSLHGWPSDMRKLTWDEPGDEVPSVRTFEDALVATADCIYGFSKPHCATAASRYARKVSVLNPTDAILFPAPAEGGWTGRQQLQYAGTLDRHERADLFLSMAAHFVWAEIDLAKIGLANTEEKNGPGSRAVKALTAIAASLDLPITMESAGHNFGAEIASYRTVLLSLGHNSFSFAAADAIGRGVPIIVNGQSGLGLWLRERHPSWPVAFVDPIDLKGSIQAAEDLLQAGYDVWRARLLDAMRDHPLQPTRPDFMREIYGLDEPPSAIEVLRHTITKQDESIVALNTQMQNTQALVANLSQSLIKTTRATELMAPAIVDAVELAKDFRTAAEDRDALFKNIASEVVASLNSTSALLDEIASQKRPRRKEERRIAFSPRRALSRMRHTWTGRIRRKFMPRLWVFEQYRPRVIRIPKHYSQIEPPASAPTIAIVTPTYNYAHFLRHTIDSVLAQNYPALAYQVRDGGSNDGTVELLKSYGDKLRWVSEPDGGQAHAINVGFSSVSADIMGWLNSDDVLMPGALAYVARYFAENPNVDVVYGCRIFIDAEGLEIGRFVLPPHDRQVLRYTDYVPQETLFWRKRVWDSLGGLDENFRFAMDWDFLLRAQNKGFTFARLPRFLACFRVHDQQKTASWHDIGQEEQEILRRRWIGPTYVHSDIVKAIWPYLIRHFRYHWAFKMGLLRY